jgi:hypothetical protein
VTAVLLTGAPILSGRELGGHDIGAYLVYAQQTAANLRGGILLPAWASDLNGGFGGPGLIFYPPLVNTVHALLPLAGLSLATGLGGLALVASLLSGLALSGWLRAAGFGPGSLWAAVLYVVAPYRVIDLYERGALAEHWAFVFAPLILWIAVEKRLSPRRRVALGSLLVAALALTNLPLLVLFGLAIGPLILLLPSTRGAIRPLLLAAPLGLALAAFSLAPQALASRWLRVELWFGENAAGAFRPSTNTLFNRAAMDADFNERVSTALVGTVLLGLAAFVLASPEQRRRAETWAWLSVLCVAFVATLGPFGVVWDGAPVLSRLQFPWRVAAPMTLVASALVAQLTGRRAAVLAILGAVLAAPHVGAGTAQSLPSHPSPGTGLKGRTFPDPAAVHEAEADEGNRAQRGLWWDYWYVPRTAPQAFFVEMIGRRSPELDPIRARSAVLSTAPATPVSVVQWDRLDKEVSLVAPRPGVLVWHVLGFPGMSVSVDGRPVPLILDRATGLVAVRVPAGPHVASWRWRPFPPLGAFRWLSGFALLWVLMLLGLPAAAPWVQSRRGRTEDFRPAEDPAPTEVRDSSS